MEYYSRIELYYQLTKAFLKISVKNTKITSWDTCNLKARAQSPTLGIQSDSIGINPNLKTQSTKPLG